MKRHVVLILTLALVATTLLAACGPKDKNK